MSSRRVSFEVLLLELSAELADLDRSSIDRRIDHALERVGSFLDADVVLLAERYEEESLGLRTARTWDRHGAVTILLDELPWFAARVLDGRVARAVELPPEAVRDRHALAERGLHDVMACPVRIGDTVGGAVVWASSRRDHAPSGESLPQLELLAQTFASALASKCADARLQDEKELADAVIESLPGMFFMLAEDGRVVRWNRNREVVMGFAADELQDRHYLQFIHPDYHATSVRMFERALAGEAISFEHDAPTKDGRFLPHLTYARRTRLGGKTYVVGTDLDTSVLRAAQEQIRRQQADLAHVARVSAVGELVAAIAHELNQPLAAIRTNAQAGGRMLAADAVDRAELCDTFADITGDAVRADEIIKRLRNLLRKGEIERARLDPNEVVRAIAPLVRADATAHGVGFALALTPDLPPVLGDAIQLQQVVLNLVRNGIDAMNGTSPQGAIAIQTRRGARADVEVTVVDKGPMLADDAFARLFQPFYTTKPSGLGIGLSLSRSIVEAHGGTMWATRNVEHGLTMHVALPCEPAAA